MEERLPAVPPKPPDPELRPAGDLLRMGRAHDRAGRLDDAVAAYEKAVEVGGRSGERAVLAEAQRRLGVVHHRRNNGVEARELCRRSYYGALDMGDLVLAGEALNSLGGFEFEAGHMTAARTTYRKALELAFSSEELRGRIEQNLGILATIHGDHEAALNHYQRSLDAFSEAMDERGCAIAYHNLGLIATQRGELELAEGHFTRSAATAARFGDVHLQGLRGEEIPVGAQVICIVDVFDALTTTRSYRPALSREAALAELERCRHWWRPDVYEAFVDSVGSTTWQERAPAAV